MLATHFLRKQAKELDREIDGFEPEAMKALTAYDWPGNIRELENEVKRAAVLTSQKRITFDDLSETVKEERLEPMESDPVTATFCGEVEAVFQGSSHCPGDPDDP